MPTRFAKSPCDIFKSIATPSNVAVPYRVANILNILANLVGKLKNTILSNSSSVRRSILQNSPDNLTLTGIAAINGIGNALANSLVGNTAANILQGLNGNDSLAGLGGNDQLFGGIGNDTFVFNTALSSTTNVDNIISFVAADDVINLSEIIFTGLGTVGTTLTAAEFRTGFGNTAVDADDRIIHNSSSGDLFYDSDGTGAAVAVKFATLVGVQTITAADFFVV